MSDAKKLPCYEVKDMAIYGEDDVIATLRGMDEGAMVMMASEANLGRLCIELGLTADDLRALRDITSHQW